jgi:hypothetical protein
VYSVYPYLNTHTRTEYQLGSLFLPVKLASVHARGFQTQVTGTSSRPDLSSKHEPIRLAAGY